MDLKRQIFKTEIEGVPATLEISELAKQANAAVLGRHGDTAILATVVMSEAEKSLDYFPLTVDYEERFYAAGKIIGSRFIRREGKASDDAVLSARLIDRTIRPLFDMRLRYEVQVTVTILAYDGKNDPDAIALLAVSTALAISNIPWNGPVAGVKIQSSDPNKKLLYNSFFAGPEDKINMIEFEGDEIQENEAVKVFEKAEKEIGRLVGFQKEIVKKNGKPKITLNLEPEGRFKKFVGDFLEKDLAQAIKEKNLENLKKALLEHLMKQGESEENLKHVDFLFEETVDNFVHREIIEHERRPDGRRLDEIRDLYAEVGIFNRTHGSALFIRGETQVLAVTTLGAPSAEQLVETMEYSGKKRFMLHYNFPSFSVGETGRSRGPGRREIGHGTLAAKAVNAILPPQEKFPYTIRIVAETLSSNGSSSMASTCAASLSLMDAGVPIKSPAAGIAIGLMSDTKGKYKILTDIQGPEDHYGDMDFKVAGTEKGINAIQMDVKVQGITKEIFEGALAQGKKARLHILETIKKTLAEPRPKISPFAPTILTIEIPKEKIGEVIGPGGKIINGIIAATGGETTIDIEETGHIFIGNQNAEMAQKAFEIIKQIVKEYKVGDIIEGPVIKIMDFGAIVDLGGGRDGMIHVSELKEGFVKKVEDILKMGDFVKAKVVRVEDGRIALSLKQLKK